MALTTQQAFDRAIEHHQAGRLHEAEVLYRQILEADPAHANALHLLGLIAHQIGRHPDALELIDRAISIHPEAASLHANRAVVLAALGRTDDALAAFMRA